MGTFLMDNKLCWPIESVENLNLIEIIIERNILRDREEIVEVKVFHVVQLYELTSTE